MANLAVSLSLLVGIVGFSEVARRTASYLFPNRNWITYVLEFISTFQLCACTHELVLLAEVGGLEPQIGLTLTYLISVIHMLSFHGAICSPTGSLELLSRGTLTRRRALAQISCQMLAAVVARLVMPRLWSLALSDLHELHTLMDFKCTNSPIHVPLLQAAAVELSCAFVFHSALSNQDKVEEKYQVHAIAAVITMLVYAGGHLTGAVFNPALAFSILFHCPGNTFAEYGFVYWMGPILGMTGSLLLFDKVIPAISGKSTTPKHQTSNGLEEKKMN
ncbi:aquaporin-11-like [Rhinichthys klamathensis goyatoka]|uniref:aquaporin-11-like n=1 Tax=Rhinichthys klamathensis goyatoka TaxID=3034132 RepID=UPI0024B5A26B|nr:aquaporin-11-like [Rhinichthys klamathensis goyatoka]